MKTKILYLPALLLLLLTTACAGEDAGKNAPTTDPDLKGLTAFAIADNATRTAGAYTGMRLDFYWTAEDKIWVTDDNGQLKQSQGDDIQQRLDETHTTITPKAKFLMPGKYGAAAAGYKVRYTGKNGLKDKVTIAATQTQTTPKDASHIGESGDCGIATATYNSSDGSYRFSLTHAAAYLTFMPFSSLPTMTTEFKLEKIKVSANQAICGEFNFYDYGINIYSRPTPTPANQSIELNLNRFALQTQTAAAADPAANAATMVIAPGQYTNFKIEYTLVTATNTKVTITKTYPNAKFLAGKNKPIKEDLSLPTSPYIGHYHFPDWSGNNINVILWYAMRGDAWWDEDAQWAVVDRTPQKNIHFGKGGVWIKNTLTIMQENPGKNLWTTDPDGVDNTLHSGSVKRKTFSGSILHQGRPAAADRHKYFFLPAWGYCNQTTGVVYDLGVQANHWGDTTDYGGGFLGFTCYLYANKHQIGVAWRAVIDRNGGIGDAEWKDDQTYPIIAGYQPLNL